MTMRTFIYNLVNKDGLLRNRHFWIIFSITLVLILFYNASYLNIANWFSLLSDIVNAKGVYAFVVAFLFLIPILYASVFFRIRGALIVWLVFLLAVIPRAIIESTSFEYILIVALFSIVALLTGIIMALEYHKEIREIDDAFQVKTTRWHTLARMLRIRDYERQYLARRLHDNVIQSLLVIANMVHALERGDYGVINPKAKKNLGKLQTTVLHVIDDVRQLSHGLRPSILDNVGLLPVLQWQADRITNENNIKVNIKVEGNVYRLPSDTEVVIYRIIKEALNNVARHSYASNAIVKLDFTGTDFKVFVHDNGRGFELPDNLDIFVKEGKLGLNRIYEQAKLLGGQLEIKSVKSEGTMIRLDISL
jgi:two-component system sensor histidine kinase DegS